jgi:fidgetin-like protein 1
MEVQCKERVDLLEALKQSRLEQNLTVEANKILPQAINGKLSKSVIKSQEQSLDSDSIGKGSIGNGTIPALDYSDLSRPPLPLRPYQMTRTNSESAIVGKNSPSPSLLSSSSSKSSALNITLATSDKKGLRSLSTEKSRSMLTTLRQGRSDTKASLRPSSISSSSRERPVPSKAATLAWNSVAKSGRDGLGRSLDKEIDNGTTTLDSVYKSSFSAPRSPHKDIRYDVTTRRLLDEYRQPESHLDFLARSNELYNIDRSNDYPHPETDRGPWECTGEAVLKPSITKNIINLDPQRKLSEIKHARSRNVAAPHSLPENLGGNSDPTYPTYVEEYAETSTKKSTPASQITLPIRQRSPSRTYTPSNPKLGPSKITRKPAANSSSPRHQDKHPNRDQVRRARDARNPIDPETSSQSPDDDRNESEFRAQRRQKKTQAYRETPILADPAEDLSLAAENRTRSVWEEKVAHLLKNLPKGVDDIAAKQILNEIVVKGEEVHWEDIAGLEIAKTALKEAVVYPFLRPDLFMGLREPVRGMLLFGPPGTGKTMLARAVATESRSTFFSISASSLTSKYLGESEKLVRALFLLAKSLAPSIIFVDEIDSLLSSRSGSGENEATRRIKTEFLIQWSDLQRAAAGKEQTDKEKGDASSVLVLAATNLPWAIDEAARRRFVRRQYIPLPEANTRALQLRNLLGHQKHTLDGQDIQKLVYLTEGNVSLF